TAIIGALVALSIIALVLSVVKIEDVTLPPTVKYGLVFDAGSSHTSLFVYEWDSDKENNTGVVSQTLSCDVQGQYPPDMGSVVPACSCGGWHDLDLPLVGLPMPGSSVHRAVTAGTVGSPGCRQVLLREQNSSVADQVLAEVAKTMREYPVAFKGAQILTGEEEGAYGWITINYLLESFTKYSPKGHTWIRPEAAHLFGALDLGGASTQISFMPEVSVINWKDISKLMLYGYNYNIYTQSYLCYGQNEMLKRLAKELIAVRGELGAERHAECLKLVCLRGRGNETKQSEYWNVTLEGRGNASGCLAAVKKLFNFSACGQRQDCTFDNIYQPPVRGQFIAFSAFYYNFKFLNLTEGQSLATVRETIEHFCTRSWEDLSSSYPEENPEELPKYCASTIYILTLLLDAYKFNEASWNNISFQMKVGNADVGWTLGYMLNLTNMIPEEAPVWVKGHVPSLWAAAVAFIVLTLVLGLAALLL
ncbi:Ectonucleoside triphosphate diphosphohydrolase 8, partial [Gavia stellata]